MIGFAAYGALGPNSVRVLNAAEENGPNSVTSHTFSVNLGAAGRKTLVVAVPAGNTASSTPLSSSVLVGGAEAMTKRAEHHSTDRNIAIHTLETELGGTQDIAVTYVGTGSCRAATIYWLTALNCASAVPTDTDATGGDASVTIPAGGLGVFAGCTLNGSVNTAAPSGMTFIGGQLSNQQNSAAAYDTRSGAQTASWAQSFSADAAIALR